MTVANRNQYEVNPSSGSSKAFLLLIGALAIAGVILIAIVASNNSGGDSSDLSLTSDQIEAVAVPPEDEVAGETGPVTVVGDALPKLEDGTDPAVGTEAPTLEATRFDGGDAVIDPSDGTGRVYAFVAHWCPHCQREVPVMAEWLQDNPLPSDVQFVVVSTGVREGQPNYPPSIWLHEAAVPALVIRDSAESTAASAFGLSGFPFFVATDGQGNVVERTSGEQSVDQLNDLVSAAQG